MNTTKLKLTNPTDDELSLAVAEHVAGFKWYRSWLNPACRFLMQPDTDFMNRGLADMTEPIASDFNRLTGPYATSADAVLQLLNKLPFWTAQFNGRQFVVTDGHMDEDSDNMSSADTFARAACIALLRANGIEVEVTL